MKKLNGNFYQQSIISVDQFTKKDLDVLFELATYYKRGIEQRLIYNELSGKILTCLFYEPSSRTFGSFIAAMQKLGGGIIPLHGMIYSSVAKGESFSDTIRTFANYSDVIVLRHPEKGAAAAAAKVSSVPLINAGDGIGEHPTQTLLDLYTIKEKLGFLDNLKITMVGDLKFGRTVHSLSKILALFSKITLYLISPIDSPMPKEIVSEITRKGVKVKSSQTLSKIIKEVDVLYITRVQKERMNTKLYEKLRDIYKLDNRLANKMKKRAIIMHPLPRVGEIAKNVDSNPRAVYLKQQMENGLFIRMALLRLILKQ